MGNFGDARIDFDNIDAYIGQHVFDPSRQRISTAADNEKTARKDGQIEDLIRGDRVLEPLNSRRHHRTGAAGDEDMAGRNFAPVGKPHPVRVDDRRPLFDEFRA